jgi:hypothetical protein
LLNCVKLKKESDEKTEKEKDMELESLRSDASNWTLLSDQKLLEALQKFSQNIDERATECVKKVDSLGFDAAEAEVGLRNIFNEFLMLGNSQFIENVNFIPFSNLFSFAFLARL